MDRRDFLRSLFSAPVVGAGIVAAIATSAEAMPVPASPIGPVGDALLRPEDEIPEAEPTLLLGRSLHRMRRRMHARRRYRRRRY